jgi:hypothetical protein
MSKILELYNNWAKPGKGGSTTPIGSTGTYINGKENTANGSATTDFFTVQKALGAEIEGFKAKAQKGDPTAYPLDDDKAMDKARTQETGGTYDFTPTDWNNPYSKSFVRE